jgi:Na+/glutamate symporter
MAASAPTSIILPVCVILLCVRAVLTILMFYLNAGLLASSQYPEGPALTGHLGTGFSWFPCV